MWLAVLAAIVDVSHVGYPLLALLVGIETVGIPVPGETAVITGGVLASDGKLSIELVILIAAAAAITGDNIGFAIGRKYGRRLLTAPGPFFKHRVRAIEIAEPFFDRHGPKAVFLGRWVSGLRITAAWMAGASGMRWAVFVFWNALGGILWAASVGLAAYYAGHAAGGVISKVGIYGLAAAALGGLVVYLVLRYRRRRAEELVETAVERAEARERARSGGRGPAE